MNRGQETDIDHVEPHVERISWDSEHFGFEVGIIRASKLDDAHLDHALRTAQGRNLELIYWPADPACRPGPSLIAQYSGFLADRKVTYVGEIGSIAAGHTKKFTREVIIEEYPRGPASVALKTLALAAGEYSRFKMDPRFPADVFEWLYVTWIERSTRRETADTVLVARYSQRLVGMCSLSTRLHECRLGLIAVDRSVAGKGVGTLLMNASHRWMQDHGITKAVVVTQAQNVPACGLYEKYGYKVSDFSHYYHFWPASAASPKR